MPVSVDAFVDGLLIGVSSYSPAGGGTSGGVIITIALTIEMAFLGLVFAQSMQVQPPRRAIPSVFVPPLMLLIGGVVGAAAAASLIHHQQIYIGLVSFGVAALLYLVTEELLLEAHADGPDEHVWWVDLQFFIGFVTVLIVEGFTGGTG